MRFYLPVFIACFLIGCRDSEPLTVYTTPKSEANFAASTPPTVTSTPVAHLAAETASIATPHWSPPSHWKALPLGNIRKGSWEAVSNDGTAEISAMAFPGDVGGTVANVNRWRQQLSLPAWDPKVVEANCQPITVGGHPSCWVTLGFEEKSPQVTIAAIVPVGNVTWFFKMTGPAKAVEAEKTSFEAFLKLSF